MAEFHDVKAFEVASWSPGEAGEGVPSTQVHVIWTVPGLGATLVMRLKSREVCNELIDALVEHRDFVFGDKTDG